MSRNRLSAFLAVLLLPALPTSECLGADPIQVRASTSAQRGQRITLLFTDGRVLVIDTGLDRIIHEWRVQDFRGSSVFMADSGCVLCGGSTTGIWSLPATRWPLGVCY